MKRKGIDRAGALVALALAFPWPSTARGGDLENEAAKSGEDFAANPSRPAARALDEISEQTAGAKPVFARPLIPYVLARDGDGICDRNPRYALCPGHWSSGGTPAFPPPFRREPASGDVSGPRSALQGVVDRCRVSRSIPGVVNAFEFFDKYFWCFDYGSEPLYIGRLSVFDKDTVTVYFDRRADPADVLAADGVLEVPGAVPRSTVRLRVRAEQIFPPGHEHSGR